MVTTFLNMPAPVMDLMRMPVFCWMSLAFGILIVGGSLWTMDHLNQNMVAMDQRMKLQG